MDKNKEKATNMHHDEIFQEFLDLLNKTSEKMRNPRTCKLERALKRHIKSCEDMLNRLQLQERSKKPSAKNVEGSETGSMEIKVDDKENVEEKMKAADSRRVKVQNYHSISEKPSAEKTEGSESGSKEIKVDEKKNVEEKMKAADSRRVKSLEEELRECKIDLEAKEEEIESLMERMGHYSDMQTKLDQRHVEDTLSLNRQSRVEQDFKAFTSDERIDTCIMIQKGYREKTDINAKRLTSMLFEVVYEYAFATKAAMIDVFKGILKFAADNGPYIRHVYSVQGLQRTDEPNHIKVPLSLRGSDCPRHVLDGLMLAIKESAPEINTDIFLMDVKQKIFTGVAQGLPRERSCKLNPSWELLHHLDDYLKACIKLTWRMVTQVPPLRLEYHTFTYKRECHKIAESQDDARDDRYQNHRVYYLWPGLVDGGGRTIIKGEVAIEK